MLWILVAVTMLLSLGAIGCSLRTSNVSHELTLAERARLDEACSLDWILDALAAGMDESAVSERALRDCLRFEMDADVQIQLQEAAASEYLISRLKTVCVVTEESLPERGGLSEVKSRFRGYAIGYILGAVIMSALLL